MILEKSRKKLNDAVREFGNECTLKYTPMSRSQLNEVGGLGDLFTADVNFRRAGAVVGGVAPYVALGLLSNHYQKDELMKLVSFLCSSAVLTVTGVTFLTAGLGYFGGRKLDKLIENNSFKSKCKYARRQENC